MFGPEGAVKHCVSLLVRVNTHTHTHTHTQTVCLFVIRPQHCKNKPQNDRKHPLPLILRFCLKFKTDVKRQFVTKEKRRRQEVRSGSL